MRETKKTISFDTFGRGKYWSSSTGHFLRFHSDQCHSVTRLQVVKGGIPKRKQVQKVREIGGPLKFYLHLFLQSGRSTPASPYICVASGREEFVGLLLNMKLHHPTACLPAPQMIIFTFFELFLHLAFEFSLGVLECSLKHIQCKSVQLCTNEGK